MVLGEGVTGAKAKKSYVCNVFERWGNDFDDKGYVTILVPIAPQRLANIQNHFQGKSGAGCHLPQDNYK